MSPTPSNRPDGPRWYEIRLQGLLGPRWSARFEGMTVSSDDGFALLTGPVLDQAALHGLLQQLRDLGLPLISIRQVANPDPDTDPGA